MDFTKRAKQLAFRKGVIVLSAPPVCTAQWDEASWIKWVDWTKHTNAESLRIEKLKLQYNSTGLRYHTDYECNKLAFLDNEGHFVDWADRQPACFVCNDVGVYQNAVQIIQCKCAKTKKGQNCSNEIA